MIQSHAIDLGGVPGVVEIDVRAERQQTTEWCWAACCCGVARFLGVTPQPTEGALANLVTGRSDCTQTPTPSACVVPAAPLTIAAVYDRLGIDRVGPDVPLLPNVLLNELLCGRPVEVGYLWYAGGGHVALVRGFRKWTQKFLVSDPYWGDGELSYAEIRQGYGVGLWAFSYGRFAKKEQS